MQDWSMLDICLCTICAECQGGGKVYAIWFPALLLQEASTLEVASQTAFEGYIPQTSIHTQSSCLERLYDLRDQGISCRVANKASRLLNALSTNLYQASWEVHCRWYHQRKVFPLTVSVPLVADFHEHLYEVKKLTVSAILRCRSTVSQVF